jgi:hypothetical protein
MSRIAVAGHLHDKPRAIALMGDVGAHLLDLRHVRVGSDTYAVTHVWPSCDSITNEPDWQSHVWFVGLGGEQRLPEYGSHLEL